MSDQFKAVEYPQPPYLSKEFLGYFKQVYESYPDHEQVNVQLTEMLKKNVDAVIWRTGRNTTKATLAESILAHFGWGGAFATAQSHMVSEDTFKEVTWRPDFIAAAKCVQTALDYPKALLEGLVKRAFNPNKIVILGSSDVVLSYRTGTMKNYEEAHNKPDVETHADLLKFIRSLVGQGTDQFRDVRTKNIQAFQMDPQVQVAVGEALYEPFRKKGVVYKEKNFFTFEPLSEEELLLYVYGLDEAKKMGDLDQRKKIDTLYALLLDDPDVKSEELMILNSGRPDLDYFKKVNAGVRWESPLFRRKIRQANTAVRGDANFEIELSKVMLALRGMAVSRVSHMVEAVKYFSQSSKNKGDESDIAGFLRRKLSNRLGERDYGSWISLRNTTSTQKHRTNF